MKVWEGRGSIMTSLNVGKHVMRWEMELVEQCVPSEPWH
jgi:hypothetical protein